MTYIVHCIDCAKPLTSTGTPPAKPICLHCDIIRFAPESLREQVRAALAPVPFGITEYRAEIMWFLQTHFGFRPMRKPVRL